MFNKSGNSNEISISCARYQKGLSLKIKMFRRAKLNFTVKLKEIFFKMSQNFYDFLTLKYGNFQTR